MINRRPIFINGFQRGGTNILMCLIASHPEVRLLGGEMHELFYGRERERVKKWFRRLLYVPILLTTRRHTFWPYRLHPRDPLPVPTARYLDLVLYFYKLVADTDQYAAGRADGSLRGRTEARMACKFVNGGCLTTPIFSAMYPDATFIGLVRNGFALCEGFMRRGWSPGRFGRMYQTVAGRMLSDAAEKANYHLIRFEDLVANPADIMRQVYHFANLELSPTARFTLQAKKAMGPDGERRYSFGRQRKGLVSCELEGLHHYMRPNVNENQISRLTAADRAEFLKESDRAIRELGYLTPATQPV